MVIHLISTPDQQEINQTIINKLGLGDYFTNDIDSVTEERVTYIGKEKLDGSWLIMRMDETIEGLTLIRYASAKNNPSYTTYSNAWSNRTSLNYSYLREVL